MASHIVRADERGNLVVISGSRRTMPFTLPAQAIERCRDECEADRIIDEEAALQAASDEAVDDLWREHFAGHGGI